MSSLAMPSPRMSYRHLRVAFAMPFAIVVACCERIRAAVLTDERGEIRSVVLARSQHDRWVAAAGLILKRV